MTRIVSLLTILFALLGLVQTATTQEAPPGPSPGEYTLTATAKIDDPGPLTVSSNGGEISNVVVMVNDVLAVEGEDYTKVIDGSRVTINFLDDIIDKDDEVEVGGQCAVSGTHEGELHNSPDWTQA